ncbi:hypothetical protein HYV64_02215 [Candidatus Shapirobacteria bacterium]|nr:hypothetical protein [Candidatus Shapirobacteria bacterium]
MKMRSMDHKFRFQLLTKWLTDHYQPQLAADVGGSKGLLAYLLNSQGWKCTVIDPFVPQPFSKYKNIETGKRVLVSKKEAMSIPRRVRHFEPEMAKDYDLLIGLHAHGVNMKIIDACKKYGKKFVLLPCCVVDEPIEIKPNIDWFESLVDYGRKLGLDIKTDKINFKGQNKILYVYEKKNVKTVQVRQ